MGLARCGTVFPVSVVVGAAVPAAVCRWGLCSRCPGVGRSLGGEHHHHPKLTRGYSLLLTCAFLEPSRGRGVNPIYIYIYVCVYAGTSLPPSPASEAPPEIGYVAL